MSRSRTLFSRIPQSMTPVEHTHRHRIRPSTQSVLLPRQIRESRSILYSLSQRALGIPSRAAHTAPHCRTTDVPELQSQQPWEVCISSPSLQIAGVSRDAFPFTTSPRATLTPIYPSYPRRGPTLRDCNRFGGCSVCFRQRQRPGIYIGALDSLELR